LSQGGGSVCGVRKAKKKETQKMNLIEEERKKILGRTAGNCGDSRTFLTREMSKSAQEMGQKRKKRGLGASPKGKGPGKREREGMV